MPTTQRACILSAAMMSSYDHSKHFILQKGWIKHDNLYAHIWFVAIRSPTVEFVLTAMRCNPSPVRV